VNVGIYVWKMYSSTFIYTQFKLSITCLSGGTQGVYKQIRFGAYKQFKTGVKTSRIENPNGCLN